MKGRVACVLAGLVVALVSGAAGQADDSRRPPDPFSSLSEAQLDSLYAPLVYLMHEDEQGTYPSLSVNEKREFLQRFWARRDPTPGTVKNEAEQTFNARLTAVNRKFAEHGTTEVPGWRTDRGRIYLEYGPPDITLTRRGLGSTLPFTVWKYTRGNKRPRKYCFVDVTGFGTFVLVYSNDPGEPTRSDWRQLVGDDAYFDALQF